MSESTRNGRSNGASSSFAAWVPAAIEQADFFNHPRVFTSGEKAWRKSLEKKLQIDRKRFPDVSKRDDLGRRRLLVNLFLGRLREVSRILRALHDFRNPRGSLPLGNYRDPVDELVFIILSRRTRERAYGDSFEKLKSRFPKWSQLLRARDSVVKRALKGGGLEERKALTLKTALRTIHEKFGKVTLAPMRNWTDQESIDFLSSLPGVGRKSAMCILMYSFNRELFPVDANVGRVLSRLNPWRESGFSSAGRPQKIQQVLLEDLVPPGLRGSVHVNLIHHGREICKPKPLCNDCGIRKFCSFYRDKKKSERERAKERPRFIDLFAGAGGLSEGLRRVGMAPAFAVESDEMAARTYALNHPELDLEDVITEPVEEVSFSRLRRKYGRVDIVAGGPPCTPFSRVNKTARQNQRAQSNRELSQQQLYRYLVEAVRHFKPRLVLMENVPAMESIIPGVRSDRSYMEMAKREIEELGYSVQVWRLNAVSFGVPQDRRRSFLVVPPTENCPIEKVKNSEEIASSQEGNGSPGSGRNDTGKPWV